MNLQEKRAQASGESILDIKDGSTHRCRATETRELQASQSWISKTGVLVVAEQLRHGNKVF